MRQGGVLQGQYLGGEVAGTTPDGTRVVALLRSGGYAEYAVAPEATVFPISDGVDDGTASLKDLDTTYKLGGE